MEARKMRKINLVMILFIIGGIIFLGGCSNSVEKSTKNIKIEYDTEKGTTQSTQNIAQNNPATSTNNAAPSSPEGEIINQELSINDSEIEIGDLI